MEGQRPYANTNNQQFNVSGSGNTTTYCPDYSTTDNHRVYGPGSVTPPRPISALPNWAPGYNHDQASIPPQSTGPLYAFREQVRMQNLQIPQEQSQVPANPATFQLQGPTPAPFPHHQPHNYVYISSQTAPHYYQAVPVVYVPQPPAELPLGQNPATNQVFSPLQHPQAPYQGHPLPTTPVSLTSLQPPLVAGAPFGTVQTPYVPYNPQMPTQSHLAVPSYHTTSFAGHPSATGTPISRPVSISPVPSVASSGEGIMPLQVTQPPGPMTMACPQGAPIVGNFMNTQTTHLTPQLEVQPTVGPTVTTTVALQDQHVHQNSETPGHTSVTNKENRRYRIFRMFKGILNFKKKSDAPRGG